jgi:hypothetical protein
MKNRKSYLPLLPILKEFRMITVDRDAAMRFTMGEYKLLRVWRRRGSLCKGKRK